MISLLLILIPLAGGLLSFGLKNENASRLAAIISALASLVLMLALSLDYLPAANKFFTQEWLPQLGATFTLKMDGVSEILCLLTAISFPFILLIVRKNNYSNPSAFYGLMMLAYSGIIGVFLAADGLLFYFFWELALIPVYFLCSKWGGANRIAVTFKFFLYTFIGSLLMLAGLVYLNAQTSDHSFSLDALSNVNLSTNQQHLLFWLFFVAFAIKMPVFPFHTWQPDTYENSANPVTMLLSALMVKMGLFGVVRWLLPIFPQSAAYFADVIIILSVIGMVYASILAMKQDDLKRLVAYASIAHIGLMSAALFTHHSIGVQGAMIQFFSHGVNVLGLWIIIDVIEQQTGTRKMSELGGLAQKAPVLTILLIVVALANIALPLTNAFVGELMMFNGLFKYSVVYAAIGGLSIILSAVYTLNMIQRVFYGELSDKASGASDVSSAPRWVLMLCVAIILILGVYPAPLLDMVNTSVDFLIQLKR
jgi:NADH-quinone oxidoreductase subunit M